MKKLHEFTVEKTVIKREETKTDEGTLVKDVETVEPVGVFIKLPQRREIEQMRVIQSAEFGIQWLSSFLRISNYYTFLIF